jgi:PAS domain S-box-containing protein
MNGQANEDAALILSAVVESSDDAIISKDLNGIIRSWNKSAERLFGYTAAEAVGQSIATLLIPADRQEEEPEILSRLRRGERVDHFETKRKRKDGTLLDISLTISPVKDPEGNVIGASKIARDITDRLQTQRATLLLSAIVDSSDDAIISKDLNGIITSWNKGAERLFGYTATEAVGQPVATLLIPADRQEEEPEILSRLRRGERVDHFETKRKRKDGALLDISLTISPVKVARDITELLRNREALQRANAQLAQSNADLEYFAYSASHDLQEPLRMVSAYSAMLRRKYGSKLDEKAHQYLTYLTEGSARMERLLRDLRAFTYVSTHAGPAPEVDANAVLRETLVNLKVAIDESRAEVTWADLPIVCLHEFQLEQLFQNIIGNAIHYRSDVAPRINIKAEPHGDVWTFSIQDNGIGIAAEYREKIFGMFKRLHTAADYSGSGMGLAICQRIVERSGGRIWVESQLGRGSTFFFTLPAAR